MILVQKEVLKVYRGTQQVRPEQWTPTPVTNYIPTMTANSQDGFVASSSSLLSWQPYYAFDTAHTLHSVSIGSGAWGYSLIELPLMMRVSELRVHSRSDDRYNPQLPRELELQGSEDGNTFTTLYSVQNPFTAYNEEQSWTVSGTAAGNSYKFFMLRMQAWGSGYWAIRDWNISGDVFII